MWCISTIAHMEPLELFRQVLLLQNFLKGIVPGLAFEKS